MSAAPLLLMAMNQTSACEFIVQHGDKFIGELLVDFQAALLFLGGKTTSTDVLFAFIRCRVCN